jgi:hypothetical protein
MLRQPRSPPANCRAGAIDLASFIATPSHAGGGASLPSRRSPHTRGGQRNGLAGSLGCRRAARPSGSPPGPISRRGPLPAAPAMAEDADAPPTRSRRHATDTIEARLVDQGTPHAGYAPRLRCGAQPTRITCSVDVRRHKLGLGKGQRRRAAALCRVKVGVVDWLARAKLCRSIAKRKS